MNSLYCQNIVNRLEKEIADLQTKIATESKKEVDKNRQIDLVNRSITKSTSLSMLQSKQRQIQGYQRDILNIRLKIAEYQKKMAAKSSELGRVRQSLLKAQQNEQKKMQQEQLNFQREIQRSIEEQKAQLSTLISMNYVSSNQIKDEGTEKQYDFFISHASEDKNDIVRDLADALVKKDIKVWYDEFELKIGDSLRKSIDKGLVNSKYGIVILSPNFIKKNWTEYELNGMVAREMNGHKVILPIWHKITKDEVMRYSPTLADKMALNTATYTIDDIVSQLQSLLEQTENVI